MVDTTDIKYRNHTDAKELLIEHYTYEEFNELLNTYKPTVSEHEQVFNIVNENVEIGEDGKPLYTISGIFAQADVVNKNGRYYPKAVLDKAMNTYIKEYVNKHRGVGEAEHPNSQKINLLRITHKIEPNNLVADGSNWIAKATILDTDVGRNIKALIDGGVKFGVSTRALGSVYRDHKLGANVVKDGLQIVAIDIVFNPSAPKAFMKNIKEDTDEITLDEDTKFVEKSIDIGSISKSFKKALLKGI